MKYIHCILTVYCVNTSHKNDVPQELGLWAVTWPVLSSVASEFDSGRCVQIVLSMLLRLEAIFGCQQLLLLLGHCLHKAQHLWAQRFMPNT